MGRYDAPHGRMKLWGAMMRLTVAELPGARTSAPWRLELPGARTSAPWRLELPAARTSAPWRLELPGARMSAPWRRICFLGGRNYLTYALSNCFLTSRISDNDYSLDNLSTAFDILILVV